VSTDFSAAILEAAPMLFAPPRQGEVQPHFTNAVRMGAELARYVLLNGVLVSRCNAPAIQGSVWQLPTDFGVTLSLDFSRSTYRGTAREHFSLLAAPTQQQVPTIKIFAAICYPESRQPRQLQQMVVVYGSAGEAAVQRWHQQLLPPGQSSRIFRAKADLLEAHLA